jgi:hypothetical protein
VHRHRCTEIGAQTERAVRRGEERREEEEEERRGWRGGERIREGGGGGRNRRTQIAAHTENRDLTVNHWPEATSCIRHLLIW